MRLLDKAVLWLTNFESLEERVGRELERNQAELASFPRFLRHPGIPEGRNVCIRYRTPMFAAPCDVLVSLGSLVAQPSQSCSKQDVEAFTTGILPEVGTQEPELRSQARGAPTRLWQAAPVFVVERPILGAWDAEQIPLNWPFCVPHCL